MSDTERVSDVMTTNIISVPPDASIYEVAEVMRVNDIGDVLIFDGDAIVGVITDRDLVVRVLASGLDPDTTRAADAGTLSVVSVPTTADVHTAVRVMRQAAVRRIPVVNADGRVEGIVSLGDLAVTQDPDSALADINAAPPNL